jgi:diadenosine tetraphosphate (Ap4A) HIT family hydrolase
VRILPDTERSVNEFSAFDEQASLALAHEVHNSVAKVDGQFHPTSRNRSLRCGRLTCGTPKREMFLVSLGRFRSGVCG